MSYAPKSLMDARAYINKNMKVALNKLGIVGDSNHWGGYHCGKDRTVTNDYSVNESSRDRSGLTNAASALDIGTFSATIRGKKHGLISFNKWLVAQCKANTPDTRDIREVIYTDNGKTVKRWDRLGRRASGDSSHLWHTHISYFRNSELRDKTALFKRFVEGDEEEMELDDQMNTPDWMRDNWPGLNSINVRTALVSGYGHSRSSKDEIYRESDRNRIRHAETIANQTLIMAKLDGMNNDEAQGMIRAELERYGAQEKAEREAEMLRLAEVLTDSAPTMATAIAEALPDDVDVNALAQALAAEMARRLAE